MSYDQGPKRESRSRTPNENILMSKMLLTVYGVLLPSAFDELMMALAWIHRTAAPVVHL